MGNFKHENKNIISPIVQETLKTPARLQKEKLGVWKVLNTLTKWKQSLDLSGLPYKITFSTLLQSDYQKLWLEGQDQSYLDPLSIIIILL